MGVALRSGWPALLVFLLPASQVDAQSACGPACTSCVPAARAPAVCAAPPVKLNVCVSCPREPRLVRYGHCAPHAPIVSAVPMMTMAAVPVAAAPMAAVPTVASQVPVSVVPATYALAAPPPALLAVQAAPPAYAASAQTEQQALVCLPAAQLSAMQSKLQAAVAKAELAEAQAVRGAQAQRQPVRAQTAGPGGATLEAQVDDLRQRMVDLTASVEGLRDVVQAHQQAIERLQPSK